MSYIAVVILWNCETSFFFKEHLSHKRAVTEQRLNVYFTLTKVWKEGVAVPFIAELLVKEDIE